jgi:HPt (histidine-containing phosphotransfer) domain-containing protein
MEGDREKSLDAGMDDHLSKPFTLDQLETRLLMHTRSGNTPQADFAGAEAQAASNGDVGRAGEHPADSAKSGFDRTALERIRQLDEDGSGDLVHTVVTHYLTESPRIIESLRKAVEAGSAADMQELAHGLKSTSANIGALSLAAFCKQMETAGRTKTTDQGPRLLLSIESEYAHVKAALEAEL